MHALSLMRRAKLSLTAAAKQSGTRAATMQRYVGSALRQEHAGGHYRATAGDRFRRDFRIPTALGYIGVPVYGSKRATELSQYSNAIGFYLRSGDESKLKPFKGRTIRVRGQEIELVTDTATLSTLAEAGELQLDQLYNAFAGGA